MFQESEIINLTLGLIAVFIVFIIFRKNKIPLLRPFTTSFFFLFGSYLFTVIEGVIWHDFLNLLEHLCLALAGVSFAVSCWKTAQGSETMGNDQR